MADPSLHELTNPTWRSQVIRVYFQNVNGLRAADNGIDVLDAFYHMETIRSDIFGFAETKLNCRATSVQPCCTNRKRKYGLTVNSQLAAATYHGTRSQSQEVSY